jgi:hypothetical protein
MVGYWLYMHAAVVDAAVPGGMSFSKGVVLHFGNLQVRPRAPACTPCFAAPRR